MRIFIAFILICWLMACEKDPPPPPESDAYVLAIPMGFPAPDIPADNQLRKSRIALGKRLFYEKALSSDSTRSCASCHLAHLAFSDSIAVSFGVKNRAGTRNTPSLTNVIYQKKLLREGGLPTLEMQILVPIQEHNEFDFNMVLAVERLKKNPEYAEMAQKAYERELDAFVVTRAIASFERTFVSGDAPFDRWHFQGNGTAVPQSAKRGYDLFQSEKLNCAKCHEGYLLSNQGFANNGLYVHYPDSGRIRLTGLAEDRALFKVPSLRNVALTAPYMHDGSILSLEAVLDHYQSGGKNHPNKSPLLQPFALTTQERADLLAFLHSLTDETFIKNPFFRL